MSRIMVKFKKCILCAAHNKQKAQVCNHLISWLRVTISIITELKDNDSLTMCLAILCVKEENKISKNSK